MDTKVVVVLVVEDNKDLQELYSIILESMIGLEFLIVSSVDQARKALAARPYSIVFMDGYVEGEPPLTVPFVKELAAKEGNPLLVAASNDDGIQDQLMAAGCKAKLNKLKLDQLPEFVRRHTQ